MKSLKSHTSLFFSSAALLSLLLTFPIFGKGKRQRTHNFHDLAKTSERIDLVFSSLDSIYQLEGMASCPDFRDFAALQQKQDEFCHKLKTFARLKDGNKDILEFERDCVVEDRKMVFRKKGSRELFAEKIAPVDTLASALLEEANSFYRVIKGSCLREYNNCLQSKREKGNQKALAYIKELMEVHASSDQVIWQDSVQILNKLRTYRTDAQSVLVNDLYNNIFLAYAEELKFVVGHRTNQRDCSNAHLRWTTAYELIVRRAYPCEQAHIEEVSTKKNWLQIVDSTWVAQQYQRSLSCAINQHRKGCMCVDAINYDSLAQEPAAICVGCMDPDAKNYCPSATAQGDAPCIYEACTEWCYAESPFTRQDTLAIAAGFVFGRDLLEMDSSLCRTNVCGCLDPCSASYDSVKVAQGIHLRNPQPDTCQIVCGCLDSLAVNYARRESPLWIKERYFNPDVTKHNPSVCIYTACKDTCALNYDPVDNPKIIADDSCICEKIDELQLDQKIEAIEWIIADNNNSVENLTQEFFAQNPQIKQRNGKINVRFTRRGNDLQIAVDIKKMKIGNTETIKTIDSIMNVPLGEYSFTEVNTVIDALLRFLAQKAGALADRAMNVIIIGEADGHPIGQPGIEFLNAGRSIQNELFRSIAPETSTSLNEITSGRLDLSINQPPKSLSEGSTFDDNLTLAFLRAYIVKQKIQDVLLPTIEETTFIIGAKPNLKKGGQFRRVTTVFTIEGFYKNDPGQQVPVDENQKEYLQLLEAKLLFDQSGYPDGKIINGIPSGQKRYLECPCYE